MYGYIYKTTDLKTGKIYIGQKKSELFLGLNYIGSGSIINRIRNYLIHNNIPIEKRFKVELLDTAESYEEINEKEKFYISLYDSCNKNIGYNLVPGGFGRSIIGTIYITNGKDNHKILPEDLPSWEAKGFVKGGPQQTRETIDKRAKANTGKKRTKSTCENISNSLKGKKLSSEHKLKLVKAKKEYYSNNCGTLLGKVSVFKDGQYKIISSSELDTYIADGYIKKGKPKHYLKSKEERHKNMSESHKGLIYITKDGIKRSCKKEEVRNFILSGWEFVNKHYTLDM